MDIYSIVHRPDISFARCYCNSNTNEEIIQFLKSPSAKFFVNYPSSILVPLMHLWGDAFYSERIAPPSQAPKSKLPMQNQKRPKGGVPGWLGR